MAVAACEGSLTVYSLRSMDRIREEVESKDANDSFMPILRVREATLYTILLM